MGGPCGYPRMEGGCRWGILVGTLAWREAVGGGSLWVPSHGGRL